MTNSISAVIAGIASIGVALFTILFNFRLRRLESKLDSKKRFQIQESDLLIVSYKMIWQNLIELEGIINDEFVDQMKLVLVNREPEKLKRINETSNKIRAEMIFLPDNLFTETENVIVILTKNVDCYIDKVAEILTKGEVEKAEIYTEELRSIHAKIINDYKSGIVKLRKLFRDSVATAFY